MRHSNTRYSKIKELEENSRQLLSKLKQIKQLLIIKIGFKSKSSEQGKDKVHIK